MIGYKAAQRITSKEIHGDFRILKINEFVLQSDNHFIKYTGSASFIFLFHMIARLDDVFCFQRADLTPNLEFSFALKSKMRWSKNVLEDRDAPDQVILGAMDPVFFSILAIAIHLDHTIYSGEGGGGLL